MQINLSKELMKFAWSSLRDQRIDFYTKPQLPYRHWFEVTKKGRRMDYSLNASSGPQLPVELYNC